MAKQTGSHWNCFNATTYTTDGAKVWRSERGWSWICFDGIGKVVSTGTVPVVNGGRSEIQAEWEAKRCATRDLSKFRKGAA